MVYQIEKVLGRKRKNRLFGIIRRNVYLKKDLRTAAKFPNYTRVETVEDRQIKAEQETVKAVGLLLRRTSTA
jgi:hypothetical protein